MEHIAVTGRLTLALVLCVAVLGKVRSRGALADFATSLRALPGLPAPLRRPLALAVVAAEGTTVVLLLHPATSRPGALAAAGLLGCLTVGVAWLVHRDSSARCHCFGASPTLLRRRHVVRNAALTVLAAACAVIAPAPVAPAALVLSAATACLLTALIIRMDDLATLLAPRGSRPGVAAVEGDPDALPRHRRRPGRPAGRRQPAAHPGGDPPAAGAHRTAVGRRDA